MSLAKKQGPTPLKHVSILASAGSGKTFQLTNRYLQILAMGAAPGSILASTFTRLAAGEIRDRILHRLAQSANDQKRRKELGKHIDAPGLPRKRVLELLELLAHNLHHLQIRTLDSFFGAIVRCFTYELGLPADARIVDADEAFSLRREAIRMMLDEGEEEAIIELLTSLTEGSERAVTDTIDATVSALYELYREADPHAWRAIEPAKVLTDDELDRAITVLEGSAPTGPKRTITAHTKDVGIARACRSHSSDDWMAFVGKGLAKPIATGTNLYYKKPIEQHVIDAYRPLIAHAQGVLRQRVINQTAATQALLELFDRCYERVKQQNKAITFADLTVALARADMRGQLDEICFRIDSRLHHILLDEMQDTNIQQWTALHPIVDETISYSPTERSFFCVGDVKQSIYGWRDACPEVLSKIPENLSRLGGTVIERQSLSTSWRSAPAVINVINQVFTGLEQNAAMAKYLPAARKWDQEFDEHSTVRTDLAGFVELRTVERGEDSTKRKTMRLQEAARLVAELYQRLRKTEQPPTIGVLLRTNAAVSQVLFELGPTRLKIPATGRGGGPLSDSPAVNAILDLLKLADHPDHSIAAFNVQTSPLGPVVGLAPEDDDPPPEDGRGLSLAMVGRRRKVASQVRRRIADDGLARTIQQWVRAIAPHTDERQYRRCMQLIDLADVWDQRGTLRLDGFIRMVTTRPVADPASSPVQVMTIHQSKGLEFDIVILPELEGKVAEMRSLKVVYERDGDAGPIARIARYVSQDIWSTFDDLKPMFEQHIGRLAYESLCLLYVAMTRARQGLFMLIDPPSVRGSGVPGTLSSLLCQALADGDVGPDEIVYSAGDARWMKPLRMVLDEPEPTLPATEIGLKLPIAFAPTQGPLLRQADPLVAIAGQRVGDVLGLDDGQSGAWSGAIRALLAEVDWLETTLPDLKALSATWVDAVQAAVPQRDGQWAAARVDEFLTLLQQPEAAVCLGLRGRDLEAVHVEHEVPFARLVDGAMQTGYVPRVELFADKARVIGFPGDTLEDREAAEERTKRYGTQILTWRKAIAEQWGLELKAVSAALYYVRGGFAVEVQTKGKKSK